MHTTIGGKIDMFNKLRDNRIDRELTKLGFRKILENEMIVTYSRYNHIFGFEQEVEIKKSIDGCHTISSYTTRDDVNSNVPLGHFVGLTGRELKWFLKKMKIVGLYSDRPVNYKFKK